jgi:Subtilase family
MAPHRYRHIRIDDFRSEATFSPPQRDMSGNSAGRNRNVHGPKLENELAAAFVRAHELLISREAQSSDGTEGVYLEVTSAEGSKLPDLNWSSQDIRLGALRVTESGAEVGALFVPASAEEFLSAKVGEYAHENTPAEKPRHENKFAPVEVIRAATIESLWTDQRPFPANDDERIWWECWCWNDRAGHLLRATTRFDLRASERRLYFPEFEIIPVYANRLEIDRILQNTSAIEELRLATDTPAFFTTTVRKEQNIWVDDLVARVSGPNAASPAVCVLDTGVAREHPLLNSALAVADCLTVDQNWGVDDHDPHGHGTNMAGAVLYADLVYPLADERAISLEYKIESVKFLPPPTAQLTDPLNYGAITQAAVALPEIENPERSRIFCMAVTNQDVSGERPTSWSAALDQICAGVMPGDEPDEDNEPPRRLFFVSAGNVPDASDPDEVSDPDEFPVEDPAQAWNAIAVGGFTDKTEIAAEDNLPDWNAVAEAGDHSPYSRISTDWDHSRTPIKPEIVFEAGNRALNAAGTELLSGVDSLSLLTTNKEFLAQPLTTFWATSPATAQAAGMAGAIVARHPDLWPESVRALIVHSADWTPAMLARVNGCNTKKDCIALARHFGYGVPRLDRALASAENDLALFTQTEIQPFKRERQPDANGRMVLGAPTFNEIHYYALPWPRQSLEDLGGEDVRLKITLSYFVEPSPGDVSPVTPARYQSYGLRFDLKRRSEDETVFHRRINRLERDGERLPKAEPDPRWIFGSQSIAAGSLHCDVWVGPAAELAARDLIAVYPVSGWWRYRTHLNRYNSKARYCLAVSISSDNEEVKLYTEIANLIGIGIETEINT